MIIVPPIFLYAETHYRFKYFFSLYKRSEPEIIADAPYRLDPDRPYPVMLLLKDADQFPVTLHHIRITLYQNARRLHTFSFEFHPALEIRSHFWHKVIDLPFDGPLAALFGTFQADVEVMTERDGKRTITKNNNHRFTSKAPLTFYRSKTHLPRINGWVYGDTHTHSTYTEDQVEFGSPIIAAPHLCKAMGISFFGVTDHSYDLDDRTDSYLLNDPTLPKWCAFQAEVDAVNEREKDFAVLRGEEVSCTNSNGNTIHYLLYGNRRYFHGSGDGAEKWFHTRCEYTMREVLEQKERDTVTFAAHPTEEVPFLQRFFLKRDEWTIADMTQEALHGIQILNGDRTEAFHRGMDIWKWMLRSGMKKFLLGGNDAHGNFNRFVQISIPMLSFREHRSQLFGRMKTAVLVNEVSERTIIDAMAAGRSVITNGPLLTVSVETDAPDAGQPGETIRGDRFVVKLHGVSTPEFGAFKSIIVYCGEIGQAERVLFTLQQFDDPYAFQRISDWHRAANFSYIRAEAVTHKALGHDSDGFCYTNPIWIRPT